jgi:hypothetical protein
VYKTPFFPSFPTKKSKKSGTNCIFREYSTDIVNKVEKEWT